MQNKLSVSTSPHIRHFDTTAGIMLDVIIALLPATIFGCALFGLKAVLLVAVCIATSVAAEAVWNVILKKPQTIGDLSAVVTGLILGINLPTGVPVWVAIIGSIAAIIVVKQMFGGLGHNFVNPAMGARIILMVSFPAFMTTFHEPLVHTVSSATPIALEASKAVSYKNLFFGMHSGSIGETSAFLLLVGGIYLVVRRVISPIIPVCFIGATALFTYAFGGDGIYAILSGGVMLGAIFMATDYVTSPTTNWGKVIYGVACGIITAVIRKFGSLPEGVSYSIILMNILTPHINTITTAKPFGYVKEGKKQ